MKALTLCVLLALAIQATYTSYDSLCVSSYGTQAFLNGEPKLVGTICSNYDYSQFFPTGMKNKVSNLGKDAK